MRSFNAPTASIAPSVGDCIRLVLTPFALSPARPDEVAEGREFASRLIHPNIVSAEMLGRVYARSDAGLYLTREQGDLTGVLAFILLSPMGLAAIEADRFDALNVDLTHVARSGEPPAGVYVWGLAAVTPRGARRVVAATRAVNLRAIPDRPWFGRAATPDGRRLLLDRLKCRPLPHSHTGLVVFEGSSVRERAA
jgi:hypothetical protein